MTFQDIVMERYAVKTFDPGKIIPPDKIDALFELIRYAPSSFNIQPWKIKVVTDGATKQKLQEAAWNQKQVTACSHYLVFCADKEIMKLADRLEKLMLENGIPEEKVRGFLGMTRPFLSSMSEEQKISWSHRQVYLALGNAMNACKSLGFNSCPMEGIEPEKFHEILALPDHLVVSCGLAVGYETDTQRKKLRFKKEEIFF